MKTLFRLLLVVGWLTLSEGALRAEEGADAVAAGLAAIQRQDYDAAIARFSTAISLNPKNGQAHYHRGWSYLQKNDLAAAVSDFSAAVDLNPNVPAPYFMRAYAYAYLKDFKRAMADVKTAVRLDPRDAAAVCLRGRIFETQGDAEKALADYNLSLQLDPKYFYAYLARGNWRQEHGEIALANQDWIEALRLNPDDSETLNNVAWSLATSPDATIRNGAEALQYATKACDLTKWRNPGLLDTLAAAYAEIGDFEEAVKWQKKAVDLTPKGEHAEELAQHLKLYQQKQPYRQPAKPKPNTDGARA